MNQESGGNATIVNKWDSNWAAGTPSVGLMQVIGPTFRSYAGPFAGYGPFEYGVSVNPLANTYAGLNYALHRYGSLAALSRPGGYANGGVLTEPVFGIGASGKSYTFGESGSEVITSQGGLASLAGHLRYIGALLEALIDVSAAAPRKTSAGVAGALGGVARGAAYAAIYPSGGASR
jgi:SLT domain-containing protein